MSSVTVLMPLFNAERHVSAAIESILAQTYRDFELLIVDDGSTDRSRTIAQSYRDPRIRLLINERNVGLPATLNRGLEEARGDFVARQDADDLSDAERLDRQVGVMRARPDLALLGTQAHAIDEDGRPKRPVDRPVDEVSIRWYGLFDNPFVHSSVIFRRRLVWNDGLRGYPDTAYAEDYALWSQLMRRHAVGNLPDRLVTFRVRAASRMGSIEELPSDRLGLTGFPDVVRSLVRDNVTSAFGGEVSDEDAALMSGFVLGVPRTEIDRFLAVFGRLLELYVSRHPHVRHTPDFSRTLARQFDAMACRVRPPGRAAALRVYVHALRLEPVLLWYFSWLRAAALLMFGRQGRTWINSARRFSRSPA